MLCFKRIYGWICPVDRFELFIDPLQQKLSGRQLANVPGQPKLIGRWGLLGPLNLLFGRNRRHVFGSLLRWPRNVTNPRRSRDILGTIAARRYSSNAFAPFDVLALQSVASGRRSQQVDKMSRDKSRASR